MVNDLEQRAREARDALDKVTRHGVNGALVDKKAIQYGLDNRLYSQADVDAAQRVYKYSSL